MSEAEREKLLALVQSLELKLNSIEQVRIENFLFYLFSVFAFSLRPFLLLSVFP